MVENQSARGLPIIRRFSLFASQRPVALFNRLAHVMKDGIERTGRISPAPGRDRRDCRKELKKLFILSAFAFPAFARIKKFLKQFRFFLQELLKGSDACVLPEQTLLPRGL